MSNKSDETNDHETQTTFREEKQSDVAVVAMLPVLNVRGVYFLRLPDIAVCLKKRALRTPIQSPEVKQKRGDAPHNESQK